MKKDNKGYSLVELLIVLAIMAVLSGLAVVTWNIVYKAKCQAGANNFNSEVNTLRSSTMAKNEDFCVRVYQEESGAYIVERGLCPTDNIDDFWVPNISDKDNYDDFFNYNNTGTPLTIKIKYEISYKNTKNNTTYIIQESKAYEDLGGAKPEGILIKYAKSDGSMKCGYGEFVFQKVSKSNKIVTLSTVTLNKETGSHFVK